MLSLPERIAASNPVVSKALQLKAQSDAAAASVNVATLGVVTSITADLLTVKPIINQRLMDNTGVTQNVGFSDLQDVPYSCDTPAVGDTVVILFLDYDISGVLTNGATDSNGTPTPQNQQIVSNHSLSNAVCIGVLKNSSKVVASKGSYSANTASTANNGTGVSEALISFIKSWEGGYANWYNDGSAGGGTQTIGYGHTGALPDGYTPPLSTAQQDSLLRSDLVYRVNSVRSAMGSHVLTQSQFDAVVDFIWGFGAGTFNSSTLKKDILANAGSVTIKADFDMYDKAGSPPTMMAGLLRRADANWAMFCNGQYLNN